MQNYILSLKFIFVILIAFLNSSCEKEAGPQGLNGSETIKGSLIGYVKLFTESGKAFIEKDPEHPGSLGIAISEAVEHSMRSDKIRYSLGSVVNFVLLHQTVVGQEAKIQLNKVGVKPDIVIGCMGGGSNFAGLMIPFARDKLHGTLPDVEIIGVEPRACPSVCKGQYRWDFGDTSMKGSSTR